jgi:hypothetical protein
VTSCACYHLACQIVTCFHADFLFGLFFDPEDGSDMLPRNVGWLSTEYTALYTRM